MKTYVRVTIRVPTFRGDGSTRLRGVWALDLGVSPKGLRRFKVVNKEGDEGNELILASPKDIVVCVPAKMHLKYAELYIPGSETP